MSGQDPRQRFVSSLNELFTRSGRTNKETAARANLALRSGRVNGVRPAELSGYRAVDQRRISEWRTGRALPASWVPLAAVLTTLVEAVRASAANHPALVDMDDWRRLWTAASSPSRPGAGHRAVSRGSGRSVAQWDPFDLNVHHAAILATSDDPSLPPLPGYLRRPHDDEIDSTLPTAPDRSVMIVLTGGSATGKTRSMYEAVHRHELLRTWPLLYPRTGGDLLALLGGTGLPAGTLLWLDELQGHLSGSAGEQAAAGLRRVVDGSVAGPVVVLASMWPRYWDEATAGPAPDQDDLRPQARQLLTHQVRRIRVPDAFTAGQMLAVAQPGTVDGRLAAAGAAAGSSRRVIQVVTGGPVVVERYEYPDTDRARYSRAVLSAAVDLRRLDEGAAIAEPPLLASAHGYLRAEELDDPAPADWANQGLAAATGRVHGIRALDPLRNPPLDGPVISYHLHDYLEEHGRNVRSLTPIPETTWDALLTSVEDPERLDTLAYRAGERLLYRYAEAFARKASAAGSGRASRRLADLLAGSRRTADLDALARGGDEHAEGRLAGLLAEEGRNEELATVLTGREARLRRQAAAGDETAENRLADLLAEQGRADDLRVLSDAGNTRATNGLLELLAAQGRVAELRILAGAGREMAAYWLVRALAGQGRDEDLRSLADAGDKDAASALADLLAEQGREDDLRRLAATAEPAARALAVLLSKQGREADLRALAAGGSGWAALYLGDLIAEEGRADELLTLAETGDENAAYRLVELFARRERLDDLRRLRAAGIPSIAGFLGNIEFHTVEILGRQGRLEELRALAAESDLRAAWMVITMLGEQGRVGDLRVLADAGNPYATEQLVIALARQEAVDDLRVLAEAGNHSAGHWLVHILHQQGRTTEMRALLVEWEAHLRVLALTGDKDAASRLADHLALQAREADLRVLATAGIVDAANRLADGLAVERRVEDLRMMAAAGNVHAAVNLGRLLTEAGPAELRWPAEPDRGGGRRQAITDERWTYMITPVEILNGLSS